MSYNHRKTRILLIVFIYFISLSVNAQWSNDPAINTAICTATGTQTTPQLISDGSGGAIIVWEDSRSGTNDIYAQKINSSGVVQWTADGVAICSATGAQITPQLISDGTGGAIIVWNDSRTGTTDIYAQSVNSSGVVQWTADGVAICSATGAQTVPQLKNDGSNGAIITWVDSRSGTTDIYSQKINSSGVVQWTADGVVICSATGTQTICQIIDDGLGGAIIDWSDARSGTNDIYSQKINSSGIVQWNANGIAICSATGNQTNSKIVSDGSAGAIITWIDSRSGTQDVYSQRVSSGGAVQWTLDGVAICTATGIQTNCRLVGDGFNGAIYTWQDLRTGTQDIYSQKVNSSGVVQWTSDGVAICSATGVQFNAQIISDGSAGAIIDWTDSRSGVNDIYSQKINFSGVVQWTADGIAIGNATNDQSSCQQISNGSGGSISLWEDSRSGTSDIYIQSVVSDGTIGTPAVVTTTAISSIAGVSASSGGNVNSDGGAFVTARGICWNTSASPTVANSKSTDGTGTGTYSSVLTGLSLNTTYYVRAYATNSGGTSYGSEVSFTTLDIPTLTTTAISSLTGATAISGGSVSNDGGASVTARGVVWNTSTSPTIALATKTSDGTGTGAFVSSLTAMSYVTTYYVRAYATNSVGTAYGNEVTFITNASSVVRTMDIFYLTSTKAFVSGETISDSGVPVTASGVVMGTTTTPTIGSEDSVLISSGLSYFSRTITNLSPGAKYFIRTFSINTDGISYGEEAILYQPQGDIVTTEEAGAPNSGDGNNDGIPDYSQFSVSSMKNINNDYTTIASSGGHTLRTVSNYASPDKSAYTYPLGVYQFKITAQRDTVIMYFHNTVSLSSYVYRKLNSQGKWVNYEKATFSTTRIGGKIVAKVTLPLEDGEAGDADGLLNGEIDDPGGPAFIASTANIPVWDLKYVVLLMCMFCFWIYKSKIV